MNKILLFSKQQYQYLTYLFCLFLGIQFLCDLLVIRIIQIDMLTFTASSLFFSINFALMDIIANVYGMREAKKLAFVNFFMQYGIAITLYLFYNHFDVNLYQNQPYGEVADKFKAASLYLAMNMLVIPIAVLFGNLFNSFLMAMTKYLFFGKLIGLRSLFCSLVGALGMLLISYTKIYWHMGFDFIWHVIFSSMLVKIIGALILMLPTRLVSNLLKVKEGVDVYDLKYEFLKHRFEIIKQKIQANA